MSKKDISFVVLIFIIISSVYTMYLANSSPRQIGDAVIVAIKIPISLAEKVAVTYQAGGTFVENVREYLYGGDKGYTLNSMQMFYYNAYVHGHISNWQNTWYSFKWTCYWPWKGRHEWYPGIDVPIYPESIYWVGD